MYFKIELLHFAVKLPRTKRGTEKPSDSQSAIAAVVKFGDKSPNTLSPTRSSDGSAAFFTDERGDLPPIFHPAAFRVSGVCMPGWAACCGEFFGVGLRRLVGQ